MRAMRRIFKVFALVGGTFLLAGCITIQAPSSPTVPVTAPQPSESPGSSQPPQSSAREGELRARERVPEGFSIGGRSLAWKFNPAATCAGQLACVEIELFAYRDCARGAFVQLVGLDAGGVVVESPLGTVDALPLGRTARVQIELQSADAETVEVIESGCY